MACKSGPNGAGKLTVTAIVSRPSRTKQNGILDFIDDFPEAVHAFMSDTFRGQAAIEMAQGNAGHNGFKRGREMQQSAST